MAYDIGTARGIIEMQYNGRGVRDAQSDMDDLGKSGQATNRNLDKTGQMAGRMGISIGIALAGAVGAAASFEKRMSAIGAVSGATEGELESLRKKALQLGKDTSFSAGESAQAMEELIKAGLSVEEVLNGAADATVNLAAAGEVDMATAATIASNAMNQFNLKAEDMANVADKIAGAANASAIDVNDFGMSLSQAGAIASLVGVSFDDMAAAIALMGNAGIKGSDAGTALKTMLSNLQPSTKKQALEMEKLGLITEDGSNQFFDAQGNIKSLADVSGVLQKSLKGMTRAQKLASLETIFGSDAVRAGAILAKEGAKGFDDMAKSMDKVKAADVAKKRLDNFSGSLEALKGSLETVAITVGTPLMNGLRVVVDMVASMVNAFLDLPGPVQEAIGIFLATASGLLLLASALIKVRALMMAMRAGALLFSGPLLLIVLAVAAAVAAFVYFYKTNDKFRETVNKAAAAVKAFVSDALEKIMPVIKRALPHIIAAGQAVAKWLGEAFTKIAPIIQKMIPHLITAGKAVAKWLGEAFRNIAPIVQEFAMIIRDKVMPPLREFAGKVLKALGDAWAQIQPKIGPAIDAAMSFGKTLAGVVIPIIGFLIKALIQWYKIFLTYIIPIFIKVAGIFVQYFGGVISGVISGVLSILTGLWTFLQGLINFIVGVFTGDWSRAWEGIKGMVSGVITFLKGILTIFWAQLKNGFAAAWALLKMGASAAWNGLKALIMLQLRLVWGFIKGIVGSIVGTLVGAWNSAKDKTSAAFGAMVGAVRNKIHDMMEIVRSVKQKIVDFFSGAGTWLLDAGKKIVQGLIDGIDAMVDKAKDALGKVTKGLGKLVPGSPVQEGALRVLNKGHSGQEMIRMIISGIEDMAPALRSALGATVEPLAAVGYATPTSGALAAPRPATPGGGSGRARLLDGELRLDPSGRAFITGVAADEDDSHDDYADTLGRMNP